VLFRSVLETCKLSSMHCYAFCTHFRSKPTRCFDAKVRRISRWHWYGIFPHRLRDSKNCWGVPGWVLIRRHSTRRWHRKPHCLENRI